MKKHVLILAALLGITTLFSCNAQKRVDASALVETIGSMTEDTNFVVTGELTDDMLNEIGNAVRNGNYEVGLDLLKTTGLTKIGDGAFWGCTGLEKITVSEENKVYDSRNNCNAIISTEDNILIVGCKNTEIPDSVTYIGGGAFSACTRLTSITIPDSVTQIGENAFRDCIGLTSITIPKSVTYISDYVFANCIDLINVTILGNISDISYGTFAGCTSLTSITIPDSVTYIGKDAFWDCTGLTSITIPDSVTRIGSEAFKGCTNLKNINASERIKEMVRKAM